MKAEAATEGAPRGSSRSGSMTDAGAIEAIDMSSRCWGAAEPGQMTRSQGSVGRCARMCQGTTLRDR
eukprot:865806-Karenia_brevis.AAC.1